MLNIDNIMNDYDKMEQLIAEDNNCMDERYVFYDGYNWCVDDNCVMFDFEHDDYVYTIIKYADGKPQLANEFSIYVGTDLIEFERS